MIFCNFYQKHRKNTVCFFISYVCNIYVIYFILLFCTLVLDMTEIELMGHAMSLFLDGSETSSITLSFILYELAKHPDCQQKAYEEINRVLEKYQNKLTSEALQEMKYLEMIISGI